MAHKKPKPQDQRAQKKMEDEMEAFRTPLSDRNIRSKQPSPRDKDPDNLYMEPGVGGVKDRGATGGVGLPEKATDIELEMEGTLGRNVEFLLSDMRDIGNPDGGDVGVPGGLAAGGEMGEGGRGHDPRKGDQWGSDIQPVVERRAPGGRQGCDPRAPETMGGTGTARNAARREDHLTEDREKRKRRGTRKTR